MKKTLVGLGVAAALAGFALAQTEAPPLNLLPEGSFELLDEQGKPQLFSLPHPNYQATIKATVAIEREGENRFLRFTAQEPATVVHVAATIPVPEGARNLRIRYRVRSGDFERAPDPNWASFRMGGAFLDAENRPLPPGYIRVTKSLTASTGGEWVTLEEVVAVPEGAARVRLQPGIYYGRGTVDLDDLEVFVEP